MDAAAKRAYAQRGLCWICRQPCTEVGQRGPRQAHVLCRRAIDERKPIMSQPSGTHRYKTLDFEFQYDRQIRYGYSPDKPGHAGLIAFFDASAARMAQEYAECASYTQNLLHIPLTGPSNMMHWRNEWFPPLDVVTLNGLLSDFNPARYVEIGSGMSTLFARHAINSRNLRTRIVSIDPQSWPESDLAAHERHRVPLEHVDLDAILHPIRAGDIVFFDGTHRSFQNSDVTVFFLDVLPALPRGVIVGLHDICLPYDYPEGLENRYFNEQYLLAARLLAPESGLRPLMTNYFASLSRPQWLDSLIPFNEAIGDRSRSMLTLHGSAAWFETVR